MEEAVRGRIAKTTISFFIVFSDNKNCNGGTIGSDDVWYIIRMTCL